MRRLLRLVGLLVIGSILTLAGLRALEDCPDGWIHSEGDLLAAGRCFGVVEGVIRSEAPELGL